MYLEFTPEQNALIDARAGTVLSLSAVGSGKTTVLAERISRAIQAGQDPSRILALTFTNRAANHLKEQLENLNQAWSRNIYASTFHALCANIVRSAPPEMTGLSHEFRIYDEVDSNDLFNEFGMGDRAFEYQNIRSSVPLGETTVNSYHSLKKEMAWAQEYVRALSSRGGVDFSGLVYLSRALLTAEPSIRRKWCDQFDVIAVDEIQDTHLSEYEVLKAIAEKSQSFLLVGDLDQSIYRWRGADSNELLTHIEKDFSPIKKIPLEENFRATKKLIAFTNAVASEMRTQTINVRPYFALEEGSAPVLTEYALESDEVSGIARKCKELMNDGVSGGEIAILIRTNKQSNPIAYALNNLNIPYVAAEQYAFFRRREIKDVTALLRLIVNPVDEGSARRIADRLIPGVGRQTVRTLLESGGSAGLRISDLLDSDVVEQGDPFWGFGLDDVVVLDTETTGTSLEDEVIEIFARRIRSTGTPEEFHEYICPKRSVGASESVHKLSDVFLSKNGKQLRDVLERFINFIGTSYVAGHNIKFDVDMLESNARNIGLDIRLRTAFDTLIASRRLHSTNSYKLEKLASEFHLASKPSHRADDDVKATIELSEFLRPTISEKIDVRQSLINRFESVFAELRQQIELWRTNKNEWRPADLLKDILEKSAVSEVNFEVGRQNNLTEFVDRVENLDAPELPPLSALKYVLDKISLSKEVDLIDEQLGVRLITIHQAKGLEFKHVFLPGMVDGMLPHYWNIPSPRTEGDAESLEEERRLLYVAATRARHGLYLSGHKTNSNGWKKPQSRFLTNDVIRTVSFKSNN